ncbi:hypothetical protein Pcinc_041787 [Petrolisthes cinctipes]|uniref:Uncharacterized protein n=1 Tax=Petrolisthes cinctipes TaxID=88211 RepID=A0AAE1EGK5_PETCI|nr:hypothetical protein Pcinc_041787 [Petrolisthes cinctipes]
MARNYEENKEKKTHLNQPPQGLPYYTVMLLYNRLHCREGHSSVVNALTSRREPQTSVRDTHLKHSLVV